MPNQNNSLTPCIYVLAGTNGAGKSSVAGEALLASGGRYFNPDEIARELLAANPTITQAQANSAAWEEGRGLLQEAIDERLQFAFETTLGGNTIPTLLEAAIDSGMPVRIYYVGLLSRELHIARVKNRVAKGGHAIPEQKIRERYDQSRLNLIHLLPKLTELRLYDNSTDNEPKTGVIPQPALLLHTVNGEVVSNCSLTECPDWAKPILAIALGIA